MLKRRRGACSRRLVRLIWRLAEFVGAPAPDLGRGLGKGDDPRELPEREGSREGCVPVGRERAPDSLCPCLKRGRYLYAHAPAVCRLEDAARETVTFRAIDHAGDGAAAEPGADGELPGGEPAGVLDDVDA